MEPLNFRAYPSSTPKVIKNLILLYLGITFLSSLWHSLIPFFSLSTYGLKHFFLWQIVSFPFVSLEMSNGLSLNLIITVLFNMYLLWLMGSFLINWKGKNDFLTLFIGGAVSGAIMAIPYLFIQSSFVYGIYPALYSLMIAWTLLQGDSQIYLFMMFPVKTKWLIPIIIGIHLMMDLSHHAFAQFLALSGGSIFGYLYSIVKWETNSPYVKLHRFENKLIQIKHSLVKKPEFAGKIYSIKTGKATLRDEEFMDACLHKISKYGKDSLSLRERVRMANISRKQRRK